MNWLSDFVRPKIKKLNSKEIADNLWTKCPQCGQMLFTKELEKNDFVCSSCDHHLRLPILKRFASLFDNGEYKLITLPQMKDDPLNFRDSKKYSDRLRTYRKNTGSTDAIRIAQGEIGGITTVIAALDFSFMGGSMGTVVGEGIVKAAQIATRGNYPFITIAASGGARMQEGILSLMQMARTTAAVNMVKEKGLPFISVLTDPTTGGVSASFAMLGDINIAEKGSVIGFAGARVIEQTIREKLPIGFQRAEYLREHGMVDIVVRRQELRDTLIRVISILTHQKPQIETLAITGK
ncbi:MAG: acetyl-CoA carboxylase carboxyltransferase subunit beta [Alphaproteobacteria bacterium]|nr:acetyl-CoA carboxylase carboxyltransferase subunit beta [Alphaproteobacteria bacterium]